MKIFSIFHKKTLVTEEQKRKLQRYTEKGGKKKLERDLL